MWILLLTTVLNIFLVKSVDPKYGLYLTASVNKTSPIVAGDVLNITFTIWLRRGGTGFIGVNDPKLQIKISNNAIISAVPTEVSINVVEEESCSASTSRKLVSEEIVTNISIIASTSSAGSCTWSMCQAISPMWSRISSLHCIGSLPEAGGQLAISVLCSEYGGR